MSETIGVGCDLFTDVACVCGVLSLDVANESLVQIEGNFFWVVLPMTAGRISGLIWHLVNRVVFLER